MPEIAQDLGFADEVIDRKRLGKLVGEFTQLYPTERVALLLDTVKRLGFRFATQSGTTIAVSDITVPPAKKEILANAEREVEQVELL